MQIARRSAVLIAAIAIGMLSGCASAQPSTPPHTEPAAVATTPPVTSTPISSEAPVALPLESGLSDEELAKGTVDLLNAWYSAGVDAFPSEYLSDVGTTSLTYEAFLQKYAQKSTDKFAPLLFGPSYKANAEVMAVVLQIRALNSSILDMNYTTGGAYKYSQEYEGISVANATSASRTMTITVVNVDNAALVDKAKQIYLDSGTPIPNGTKVRITVTYASDGTKELITAIKYTPAD